MHRKTSAAILVNALILFALAACGESSGQVVTRQDLGEDWPLTVDSAQITCEAEAVFVRADGKRYPVNGQARQMADGSDSDLEDIWAEHPAIPGTRKDVGPLIQKGLAECDA